MSRNGIMLPGAAHQQPMLQVAAPLNDVQLVSQLAATLSAGQHELSAADAVNKAQEIVVEAFKGAERLSRTLRQVTE